MPKISWVKPTPEQQFQEAWRKTNLILRKSMLDNGIKSMHQLSTLSGISEHTLCNRFSNKAGWKQEELIKIIYSLNIPPEDAVKMLCCG